MTAEKMSYMKPRRAFKRLKTADDENVTAYIYGVCGMGKTELFIRYLGKRKYTLLDAGRIKQEDLKIERGQQRKIVVIDNLHELTMEEEGEAVRQSIVAMIEREDIWLILCGRCAVPPWLTEVRYREVFYVIQESDLVFDDRMVEQFAEQQALYLTEEQLELGKAYCRGVPIAWTMCAEIYRRLTEELPVAKRREPLPEELYRKFVDITYQQMWDYLEAHVYDCWDISIQEFLMEVSIADSFDVQLAEMITGRNDVEKLIEQSRWIGNFMVEHYEKEEIRYEFLPEMLVSMRRRLKKKYSKEKIYTLYTNAGLYYQLHNRPLEALEMYQTVGDMERIASILVDNVRRAPNNGFYYELKKYYLALPEEKIRKSIELMCGMSMLQSLLLNVEESERWYEELQKYAKEHTGGERRTAKSRLLYLEISLPHRGSEDMIEILKRASGLLLEKQVSLQEFSVTSNQASQMNGGKDFCEWSKRDRELARTIGKAVELVLGKYGKGLVNLALAESFLEKGGDNYEVAALANKGRMQAESVGRIEQCFVADGILAWLHILTGKAAEAEELLTRFYRKAEAEGREKLLPNVRTFLIRSRLYGRKRKEAEQWLTEEAPDVEQGFSIYDRFHYMTMVRIYLQQGRNEQAYNLLSKCEYYAKVMKRTYVSMEVKLLMAVTRYRSGDTAWQEQFSEMLSKAEEYHFVRIISREGAAVLPLLNETKWRPTEVLEDPEASRRNRTFWRCVQDETARMARSYPDYLRSGMEPVTLSDTMRKILSLQAEGFSKERIAEQLNMSVSNVKYHTQQIYKKLGVSNKTEAVMEAGKRGLL